MVVQQNMRNGERTELHYHKLLTALIQISQFLCEKEILMIKTKQLKHDLDDSLKYFDPASQNFGRFDNKYSITLIMQLYWST